MLEVLLCLSLCVVLRLSVVVFCLVAVVIGGSGPLCLEFVVHLLQELRLVVERFEVELAVKLPLRVVLNGIARRCLLVDLCAAIPLIGRLIFGRKVDPVGPGDLVDRYRPGDVERLVIIDRCSQLPYLSPDGVLPALVVIGVKIAVDWSVRLVDTRIRSRLEVGLQCLGDVPRNAGLTQHGERLGVGDGDGEIRFVGLDIPELLLVIGSVDLGREGDAVG